MTPTILHIDFDSFFASCEQHFNPNLRGKPIGITAENGRNCIIAASREAKKRGVKSPSPAWEAREVCPEITLVKADFERYLDITKKFIQIATLYSPLVEVFSLDEVFVDMTSTMHLYKNDPHYVIKKFKEQIAREISPYTTVSIGVSYNKLLAKLGSGMNKPDGYFIITKENLESVYKNTKLTDICGIGERLKRRLNMLGIQNLFQLRDYPPRLLKKEFGNVCSQNLLAYAWATDDSPVVSYLEEIDAKSVGRNFCLPKNEYDQDKILQTLSELCEEVGRRLRIIHKKGRTVSLYLAGETSMGGRKTVSMYTHTGKDIFQVIKVFLDEWKWTGMVRQIHMSVSNLIDEKYETIGLFENPKESDVLHSIDRLNERFGNHTIRRGYVLNAPRLDTKPNGFFGDKVQRQQLQDYFA